MERWFEFMSNHPFLFGTLFVLVGMFFSIENKRSGKKIAPNALGMMVNNQNAVLIDIRPTNKFTTGYISGSRNIPFTELKNHLNELQAITAPIFFKCLMGIQEVMEWSILGKQNAMRLEGGITNYQAAGLPLITPKTKK